MNPVTEDPMLAPDTAAQIEHLTLDPATPLLVSDADEVLVAFLAGLERYLESRGCYLDFKSFRLTGNIKELAGDRVLGREETGPLLRDFFASETALLDPVPGAAEALQALATRCQVVVLSNVPAPQRQAREDWLAKHGMPYPIVSNEGLKGPALAALASRVKESVFFIDDLPHNIDSAAASLPRSKRIHFVNDRRMAALVEPAASCHLFTGHWGEAKRFIERHLDETES